MNHLRFLRYFDEVARCGSIRAAAERLHVAPSAVNRRIQDLEDELGVALFERLPRGMRLTAAGERFADYVRGTAAELEAARSDIEGLQGLRRGAIRLVASQALAPDFLPAQVAAFRAEHPAVEFSVRIGDHLAALQTLRSYESDLAVVFNLPPEGDIEVLAQVEQRLRVTLHRSHPLARSGQGVRIRDCLAYPLFLPGRELGGRRLLERFLARSGTRLRPAVESNSFEFLHAALRAEPAISFQVAIGVPSGDGEIVGRDILDRGFPAGQLVVAGLRGRQLPALTRRFADRLIAALGGDPPG